MSLFLVVDQSTSATKVLLFDASGNLLDRESVEHQQLYPQPGWVEHDAEEIWRNFLQATRVLLARSSGAAEKLSGLSITNQRETAVVFDRASGRPLRHAIVWQCRRGDPYCEAQVRMGREGELVQRTGLRPDAYFSASKLQWVMENEPTVAEALRTGKALAGTIDAYLIYRLTRGRVFATDATNASRTLLYDIEKLRWDAELCAWWRVPLEALPEVRDSTAHYGATGFDGLLKREIPICGVMGDSQAALFGEECWSPGTAKITFGTGSSILLNVGNTPKRSGRGVVTSLAWSIAGRPTYAFEGIIISSAATLTWLRDQLGVFKTVEETQALAEALSDNQGVYLVPAFSGLGLPHWQPSARAAIVGLTSQSDRRHVARAGLESIAYQVRDALDAMRADAGVEVRRVHANGGATANRFLMQFTADITGVELQVSDMPDRSAYGALLAGMLGLGIARSVDELPRKAGQNVRVYQPRRDTQQFEAMYEGWKHAVRQVLA